MALVMPVAADLVWQTQTINDVGSAGQFNALAYDSGNHPGISYYDDENTALIYAYYDGTTWNKETVDNTGVAGMYTSLAFDGSDNPVISYYDQGNTALKCAWYDGASWHNTTVDATGDVGSFSSLAIDTTGIIGISYVNSSAGSLKYAEKSGDEWQNVTVDATCDGVAKTSMAFDGMDTPAISYYDSGSHGNLKYASCDAGTWSNETVTSVASVGSWNSLAFDGSDHPCISYVYSSTLKSVRYASYDGSVWQFDTVEESSSSYGSTSLDFDAGGDPVIAYSRHSDTVRFASYNGTGWELATIATPDYGVGTVSLATDSNGNPGISYDNLDNWFGLSIDLLYAYGSPVGNLNVTSVPSGATIVLDGTPRGEVTNTTLTNLPVGTYAVTVQKDGFVTPAAQNVAVTEGNTTPVSFALTPQTGNLTVTSDPAGAWIWIEGGNISQQTPFTIPNMLVGTRNVTVQKEGYEIPLNETVTITNATTTTVDFTLAPLTGNVTVTSVPTGAWVWIDGANTTEQTGHEFSLPIGDHNVSVRLDYYVTPANRTVTITDGCTLAEEFTLAHEYGNISVNSTPSDAWIWLDGANTTRQTNSTLLNVEAGPHNVTVRMTDYITPIPQDVTVTNGTTAEMTFALTPEMGNITVTSDPAGAWIWLDGMNITRTTPFTLTDMLVGEYNVTVTKTDYQVPANRTVTVTNATTTTADFSLELLTGNVTVTSTPSDAWVWIDGANTTQTTEHEFTLPIGDHNVTVRLDYYVTPANSTVTITDGCSLTQDFLLAHEYGNLSVNSTPADAWIWLDGANTTRQTNTTLTNVIAGPHNVTIAKTGYAAPVVQDVTITNGTTTEAAFTLTPLPPVADFTVDQVSGPANLTVNFTDASTGVEIACWNWSFGDDTWFNTTNSALKNPSHTYDTAGAYTATLFVTSPGGTDSATTGITVAMLANFTATPLEGLTGMTVQFNDTSLGAPDTWAWDFGDGATATEQNPSHAYTTAGTYSVTLTAGLGAVNDTETKTGLITVTNPAPTPTPTPVRHGSGSGSSTTPFVYDGGTGTILTSFEGKVLKKTLIHADDGLATLTLAQGVVAHNADGTSVGEIAIVAINASELPDNLNSAFTFAGHAYRCTPTGATFAPSILLTFAIPADEWDDLDADELNIRFYDEKTGVWVELPATVNTATRTITAEITHFSIYGLFAGDASATTVSTTQPTVVPDTTAPGLTETTAAADTTPAPGPTRSAPLGCIPLIALGAFALLWKRR
ncbi:hypothetical protein AZH53_00515 [Methanomicrobiaceae archaeon CYW5]|nr:hypothetical protein [Methanovulcanius yangii]